MPSNPSNLTQRQVLAVIISPNGTVEAVSISGNLDSLQKIVGGDIEGLTLSDNLVACLHAEGKFTGKLPNLVATRFVEECGYRLHSGDVIAGNLVLTGVGEDGEPADVTFVAIHAAARIASNLRVPRASRAGTMFDRVLTLDTPDEATS